MITVYSRNGCVYCNILKAFINGNGGTVDERNIDTNETYREEFEKFGVMGVPVTVINGEPNVGFNPQIQQKILQVLKG